jgi:hypothetical protein
MLSIMHCWRNRRRPSNKLLLQPSKQQRYNPPIFQIQQRFLNNKQLQKRKINNHLHRTKEPINNSQITKIQTVILILKIVAAQMEPKIRILHLATAHQETLHPAIAHQVILHHLIQLKKTKLKIKPHLLQITGSYKMSRIYRMIL